MSLCASYITALNGQLEHVHTDNNSPKRIEEEELHKKMPTTRKTTVPPTTQRRLTTSTRRRMSTRRRLPVTTSTSTSTTTTTVATTQGPVGGYIPTQRIVHFDLKVISVVRRRPKKVSLKGAPPAVEYLTALFPLLAKAGATGIMIEWEDTFPYKCVKPAVTGYAYTEEQVRTSKGA